MINTDIKLLILEEVCEILTCGVASTPKYVDAEEGVAFLSAQNVKDGEIILDKYRYISKEFHKHLTKKNKPKNGDILYSRVGSKYGEAAIVNVDFEFSVYVSVTLIRPKSILNNFYLKYYLNSPTIKEMAKKTIKSSGVPNLNVKDVRNFPIPIPPLPEQQKIVEKLDTAFELIDQAKANIEKNIQNAKELFQSKLNEVFSKKGDGWEEKKIEEVCEVILAGGDAPKTNFSKDKNSEYTIPIFANAVKNNGLYGYTKNAKIEKPSLTIAARGSGTGFTCLRFEPFLPIVRLLVLTPSNLITLEFLKLSIDNQVIKASGSAIPQFTVPMLKKLNVFIPKSLETQQKIVEQLDQLSAQTELLQEKYTQKLANLEELKKSVLEKAFKGELV